MGDSITVLARLRRDRDVRRVLTEGRRWQDHLLVFRVLQCVDYSGVGLAVVIPRAWGRAIARSRIKRWIKESIRHILRAEQTAGGWWLVVMPRSGAMSSSHAAVQASLQRLLREAGVTTAQRRRGLSA